MSDNFKKNEEVFRFAEINLPDEEMSYTVGDCKDNSEWITIRYSTVLDGIDIPKKSLPTIIAVIQSYLNPI